MTQSSTETGGQGQESTNGNQGQGQEPSQQQGGQGQESGAQQGGQQSGQHQADISAMSPQELASYAATLQRQAQEARQEAARYRTDHQAAQGRLTEMERAQMTEQQRIQADLDAATTRATEAENRVKDLTTGHAAREALAAAGAINAMTAFRTLDLKDIPVGDDGTPDGTKLSEAIARLKTSDPYLFRRSASADAGAGGGPGGAPETGASINDFVRGRSGR